MFGYDEPPYVASLLQLPPFFRYLDKRYGKPDLENPKKKNGEYALRLILRYLSEHKRSTCEEIAKYEYDRNISSKRKLKSITDDIRKFVNHNLIPTQLVFPDESKKKYNKQVKTYSLSPVGVLYSLYLFGNFRIPAETEEMFYDLLELESDFLKNISKEYVEVFPKIFGQFENLKNIFGKDFLSVAVPPIMQIYESELEVIPSKEYVLTNYVLSTFDFINAAKFKNPQEFLVEQCSLIFYIHFEESIEHYLWSKENEIDFEKIRNMSSEEANRQNKEKEKKSTERYRGRLREAKKIWTKFMEQDKILKKWYKDFLKEAVEVKKIEKYAISQYQKELFV